MNSFEPSEELGGVLEVPNRPEMSGGYADIYHGVWITPQSERIEVAVKELKALRPRGQQTTEDELIKKVEMRIAREAFVWSRIQHRNLHPLLGYRSQPEPRLISPWCRHGNLMDYVRRNPDLSRLDKLTLIYQAAYGLEHLHSRIPPICHADVKPENVLVNDWREAAFSDFGLSRVLHGLGIPSGFTTSKTMKGTLNYRARELWFEETPTCNSDVYAFGGLILAVMSGKPPFCDVSEPNLLFRVINNQPPRPEDHADLPEIDPLWSLMRGCWDQNPATRPTMQKVLWELWELISLETTELRSRTGTLSAADDSTRMGTDLDTSDEPQQGNTAAESNANVVPAHNSQSSLPGMKGSLNSVARGVFPPARDTFRRLQVNSKTVPIFGKYIRAAVAVGLMLIDIVKTMDRNQDMANALESNSWKLAVFLDRLQASVSEQREDEIASCISDIKQEFRSVQRQLKEIYSSRLFPKAFSCCDNAEGQKQWEGMALKAWETLELVVNLNTTTLMVELKDKRVQEKQRRLLNRLGDGKYGAQGNAIEDVICLPGTRVQILDRIDEWIRDISTVNRVLWIRGMAGRGKSTIVSTVAHNWQYRATCALFHFRRGQDTVNGRIVCALARQLGSSLVPEVRNAVMESMGENEDIADQRLSVQFETLFVAPLSTLKHQPHPVLIMVDALDECEDSKYVEDFVKLIDQHSSSLPINVKFLLTCRPEAVLLRALEPRRWHIENLDCSPDIANDLAQFFRQAFLQIREHHKLSQDWPSRGDVNRLVEMSQGLFQWARTATTYIGSRTPANRLHTLLNQPSMWSGLDDLYHQILSKAVDNIGPDPPRRELLCQILGTLVVAPHPVSLEVIVSLLWDGKVSIFQGAGQEDIARFLRQDILVDLYSLLLIPTSSSESLCLMHNSIRDLLVSEQRSKDRVYYIDITRHHEQLAGICLRLMVQCLKENICNLSDLSTPNSEIQDIVDQGVSTTIRYCCRAWSIHLTEGTRWSRLIADSASTLRLDFETFSRERVLYWLEIMSLVGATTEAMVTAERVHQWLLEFPTDLFGPKSFKNLWNDTQRFITAFWEPISFGSLHIYVSALPHCPQKTTLWEWYGKHAKIHIVYGAQPSVWPCNLWTRSAFGQEVKAVAFSPDGVTLASAVDGIRLWDVRTGTPLGKPFSYWGSVSCIAFSPDGQVLAGGFEAGNKIQLWDPQTGTSVGKPFTGRGHLGQFTSVAFSPDGKLLASGSTDCTIRLWMVETSTDLVEPLTGHDAIVTCIAFSPDGKVLASGSHDSTVRLWVAQTGTPLGEPLIDHSFYVNSVAFSPDGKLLASGSRRGIRLWDPQARVALREPLKPHQRWVDSLAFSHDGKVLAYGSVNGTIGLWDPHTGTRLGVPLTGHHDTIGSVAFSPDGKFLASGSIDGTIRLWDPQSVTPLDAPAVPYDERVTSIDFSPDGKVLASGSEGWKIRLWDPQTGKPLREPLTGHDGSVACVAFSPDGKVLASGSKDWTVRLWNAQTWAPLGQPLTGRDGMIESVAFSPNGKILAAGSSRGTILLWDTQTRTPHWKSLTSPGGGIVSIAFSPDGKVLASGHILGTTRLWSVQTGKSLGEVFGHGDYGTSSVAFSRDVKVLASKSSHGMIEFFDADTRVGSPMFWSDDTRRFASSSPKAMKVLDALAFEREGVSPHILQRKTKQELNRLRLQPTQAPRIVPDSLLLLDNGWLELYSRILWLPSQYWSPIMLLSNRNLVIVSDGCLSIFDVSAVL